jgi:hypothetical protein
MKSKHLKTKTWATEQCRFHQISTNETGVSGNISQVVLGIYMLFRMDKGGYRPSIVHRVLIKRFYAGEISITSFQV